MKTEGRPLDADIQLWVGPDWTPLEISTYSEDGLVRPVQTLIGTRNKIANVEVRNTAPYEFPLTAACTYAEGPLDDIRKDIAATSPGRYVEGGSIYSVPFDPFVDQIQVLLK